MNTPSASKRRCSTSPTPPRAKRSTNLPVPINNNSLSTPTKMADSSSKILDVNTVITNGTPATKETSSINSTPSTSSQIPSCSNSPNDMLDLSVDMLKSKVESLTKKKTAKMQELDREIERKRMEAIRGMKTLLKKSEKYCNYFKNKIQHYRENNEQPQNTSKGARRKRNEHINKTSPDKPTSSKNTIETVDLKYFEGGSLMPHQIEGLLWLTLLFENGINGILADEMGLGKTIQVIALICRLFERKVDGPYLIIGPLSVLNGWASEFERFAPQIPVMKFYGSKEEWPSLQFAVNKSSHKLSGKRVKPVILTTYEGAITQSNFLQQYKWQYVIIDEGQRIKNADSILFRVVKNLKTSNKLLLTGTPIQNNLTELWALLNFILPQIFVNMDTFASILLLDDLRDGNRMVEQEESAQVISTIHKVLAPFMLRRTKADCLDDMVPKKEVIVYCPLSQLQLDMYVNTINKNISALKREVPEETEVLKEIDSLDNTPQRKRRSTRNRLKSYVEPDEDDVENLFREDMIDNNAENSLTSVIKKNENYAYRITLQSTSVMCKKIVDHPYLVELPLKIDKNGKKEVLVNEDLVAKSGKMLVLDAMLSKLKKLGHKVLIFSTLVILLDLVEEYVLMRGYKYCRLDGNHNVKTRTENIKRFNEDPDTFLFLISTRAGGLGLNLTSADTVILFDRDWNPQVDIQAQARCHRIGQTKPVMIYSLITKNTIDEKILEYSEMKRRLEKVVIQDGKFKSIKGRGDDSIELNKLLDLLKGEDSLSKIHANGFVFSDEELENLLDRSELYRQLEESKKKKSDE